MEVFIEQLVKRKTTAKSIAIIVTVLLLLILIPAICVVLAFNFIPYFLYIGFFILLLGIYVAWYFITSQRVEYEYSVIGNEIGISKIVSKRKRKKIVSLEIKDFDMLCKISDKRLCNKRFTKKYVAAADMGDEENTYAGLFNNAALGHCVLFFTPQDKIMQAMKPYLKKEIVLELFYNRGKANGAD